MLRFKEHITEDYRNFITETLQLINEKLIVFRGRRSKYGRIVFLAGGGASGKGFARTNLLDISQGTDKIRDVDDMKTAFLKLDQITHAYPELRGLDMRNPDDTFKLHQFIKSKGIKEKTLNLLLGDLNGRNLPNIVFDVTLKDRSDIDSVIPKLLAVGYNPLDIHLVWILTKFEFAVKNNLDPTRGRIVPEEVLLDTHEGAARTMYDILQGQLPAGLNGEIWVINNNPQNLVKNLDSSGRPIGNAKTMGPFRTLGINAKKDSFWVKSFFYIKVKDAGSGIDSGAAMGAKMLRWLKNNAPASAGLDLN